MSYFITASATITATTGQAPVITPAVITYNEVTEEEVREEIELSEAVFSGMNNEAPSSSSPTYD